MLFRKVVGMSLASLFALSLVVLPTPSASADTKSPAATATPVKKEAKKSGHHAKKSIFHSKKAAKHASKSAVKTTTAAPKTTK